LDAVRLPNFPVPSSTPPCPHWHLHHRWVHTAASTTVGSIPSLPHWCTPSGPHRTASLPPPSTLHHHHRTGVCRWVHTTPLLLLRRVYAVTITPVYAIRSTPHCSSSSAIGSTLALPHRCTPLGPRRIVPPPPPSGPLWCLCSLENPLPLSVPLPV
jgi:hypothetical protein